MCKSVPRHIHHRRIARQIFSKVTARKILLHSDIKLKSFLRGDPYTAKGGRCDYVPDKTASAQISRLAKR